MLRQRSRSAVIIVLVAAVPAFIGGPVFSAVVLLLGLLAVAELLRALESRGARPLRTVALAATAALIGAVALRAAPVVLAVVLTGTLLISLTVAVLRPDPIPGLQDWALTVASTLYVALPLAHVVALRALPGAATQGWVNQVVELLGAGGTGLGLAWFGLTLAVTWLTDTAAYLIGRALGKTKLIPAISPGKTRVGAGAGLAAGTLAGVAAAALFGAPLPWSAAAGVGLVLAGVGQLGDLSESLIKRSLGIKDMGHVIPGHGGILDRIDALLFTAPVAYYLARLL
ncbi:MAG: phosphatidate cytidylyltransferase [Sphaerobacter sp.]|nr:phosphatidate cytidylyltransferase [Sphaerobacter sp.]